MSVKKSKLGYGRKSINYPCIDHQVDSIILGDGSTRITTMYNPKESVTGISFSVAPEGRPVGELYIEDGVPKDPNEDPLWTQKNAYFQILADNPASIDVLILRLQEAKWRLLQQLVEGDDL